MKILNPNGSDRTVAKDDPTNRSYPFDFSRLKKWVNNPVGDFEFSERNNGDVPK